MLFTLSTEVFTSSCNKRAWCLITRGPKNIKTLNGTKHTVSGNLSQRSWMEVKWDFNTFTSGATLSFIVFVSPNVNSQAVCTHGSYSGFPGSVLSLETDYTEWGLCASLPTFSSVLECYFKVRHSHFFFHDFQFIINYSSCYLTLHNYSKKKWTKNK
jgi:hypothetical protein